jgi:hypothetical protein
LKQDASENSTVVGKYVWAASANQGVTDPQAVEVDIFYDRRNGDKPVGEATDKPDQDEYDDGAVKHLSSNTQGVEKVN